MVLFKNLDYLICCLIFIWFYWIGGIILNFIMVYGGVGWVLLYIIIDIRMVGFLVKLILCYENNVNLCFCVLLLYKMWKE